MATASSTSGQSPPKVSAAFSTVPEAFAPRRAATYPESVAPTASPTIGQTNDKGDGSSPEPAVAVIIPAWNEGAVIASTVRAVRTLEPQPQIIVVDDGSDDDTAWEAAAAGARVVTLPRRRGKAAAVRRGVGLSDASVLMFLDADLGASAQCAQALLAPILADEADMTVGCLPPSGRGGGFGYAVNSSRWALRRLTGATLNQPLSGQRALRRQVLSAMRTWGWGFGLEVALSAQTLAAGFTLTEVAAPFQHRVTGFSYRDIFHRARQFLHIWRTLVALAWFNLGR